MKKFELTTNTMTNKEIEARLEELEQIETQIRFATSKLSADDHVRLARIKEERKELKEQMKK